MKKIYQRIHQIIGLAVNDFITMTLIELYTVLQTFIVTGNALNYINTERLWAQYNKVEFPINHLPDTFISRSNGRVKLNCIKLCKRKGKAILITLFISLNE